MQTFYQQGIAYRGKLYRFSVFTNSTIIAVYRRDAITSRVRNPLFYDGGSHVL